MRLLITNGSVVTADGETAADVLCADGVIAGILQPGADVAADETLDATGQLVFPGFIDPHVHSRDPGATHKDDFEHSTLGALLGGVTTVLEMPNAIPPVENVEIFHERREYHGRSAWTDFGLWGLALGTANIDQIGPLFEAGAVAVKLFWGYSLDRVTRSLVYNSGDSQDVLPPATNGEVLELCRAVAATGGVLAAHCEDSDVLGAAAAAVAGPVETYDNLLESRPATAEAVAIAAGAELAAATGCRFHVVHMASADGVAVVRSAQERGVPISAETCPHYLSLSAEDFAESGSAVKVYPLVRGRDHRDALWAAVNDGVVSSIGSDHAPHTVEEKSRPFAEQPAGAVGTQTIAPVMIDAMVRGSLSAARLAEVLSTATARLYGLYPRKGVIRVGSDADLTLVDPHRSQTVSNASLVAKQPMSPWDGATLRGMAVASVLRGEVVMREGERVGERRGEFVAARHVAP